MTDRRPPVPPPHGMEGYDLGALDQEQQDRLWNFKINSRIANEYYLRDHPEVEWLLSDFLRSVLLKRPEDIRVFASEYYTDAKLPEMIQNMRKESSDGTAQN
ncbi:RIIa domain-containing protein 1-like [Scyliorhinus canicula]|uniref:RIIa domain-containing protein 1-like n=1 Tax=Scyliorhinus canicula TaxID=7830 RepID=UPI0018F4543C|nr:RIIa domain-containing protein 1-like [Scyliorhinus canicula]